VAATAQVQDSSASRARSAPLLCASASTIRTWGIGQPDRIARSSLTEEAQGRTTGPVPAGTRCEQRDYWDFDSPGEELESEPLVPLVPLAPLLLPELLSDDMPPPDCDVPPPLAPELPAPASSPARWQAASEPAANKGNSTVTSHRLCRLFISIFLVQK
jgi:hypothetical protein